MPKLSEPKTLFPAMFWNAVQRRQDNGQRFGQAVFNTAYGLYPHEVNEVRATQWDPFYDDARVDQFLLGLWNRINQGEG